MSFTSSSVVTLPFSVTSNFFPPNGTGSADGGANGYQAATLSGVIAVPTPELISFSVGADDMAFAFLDGAKVCDLGGVHGSSIGACVTPFIIASGSHLLQVFFADMNQAQSSLIFDIKTQDVVVLPVSNVPEPETWALMLAGLVSVSAVSTSRYRKVV